MKYRYSKCDSQEKKVSVGENSSYLIQVLVWESLNFKTRFY